MLLLTDKKLGKSFIPSSNDSKQAASCQQFIKLVWVFSRKISWGAKPPHPFSTPIVVALPVQWRTDSLPVLAYLLCHFPWPSVHNLIHHGRRILWLWRWWSPRSLSQEHPRAGDAAMDLRWWKRWSWKNHNELLLGDAACQAPKEGTNVMFFLSLAMLAANALSIGEIYRLRSWSDYTIIGN